MKHLISLLLLSVVLLTFGCGASKNQEEVKKMEKELQAFEKQYVEKVKPITVKWYTAYFEASVSGKKEDFEKASAYEMQYNVAVSNKADFAKLKKIKESGLVQDSILQRSLILLYNEYLSKQVDTNKLNAISKLQSAIEQKYSNFRAKVGNQELSDNDVELVLKTSKDSKKLEEAWNAHKQIGPIVAADIIKLVKMRNEIAKELGFKNYYDMSMILTEQEPAEIAKIFDELDNLTKSSFITVKKEMDDILAKDCNIKPEDLMPWHYQNRYFQEAPNIYPIDLDKYYENKDLVKMVKDYYTSLGLPIDNLVAKSDLFEKPGKNQHAYCINIDRDAKDIRVLCNVKPNANWMGTLLHEFGHSQYENYYESTLPWEVKIPAHTFTTEAIAMMFGRFSTNPQWMQDMLGISNEEKAKISETCHKSLVLQQLVFSRWSQVMYRFEQGLYTNPDQDLNKLWWDLVEKYQMIKKPAGRNLPDWASKIHIATSPCYYHNYHLGELLASQLYYTLSEKVLKGKAIDSPSFYGKKEVGDYLVKNVFSVGAKYSWNDMIEHATGEKLTPKYYAKQFVTK